MTNTRNKKGSDERHDAKKRIHKLLADIEKRLESETAKASVTDYIRLLQLERELEENEAPAEIRITWVESKKTSPST